MKLAGRVPSRVAKLKEVFEANPTKDKTSLPSANIIEKRRNEELIKFKRFRHKVSKICSKQFSKSQPRVLVGKFPLSNDNETTPPSRLDQDVCDIIEKSKKCLSELNVKQSPYSSPIIEVANKNDTIVLDSFVGWLISLFVISNLLLCTDTKENNNQHKDSCKFDIDILDQLEDNNVSYGEDNLQLEDSVESLEICNDEMNEVYSENANHSGNNLDTTELKADEKKAEATIIHVKMEDNNYGNFTNSHYTERETYYDQDESENNVIFNVKVENSEESSSSKNDDQFKICSSRKYNLRQKIRQSFLNPEDEDDNENSPSSSDSETSSDSTYFETDPDESVQEIEDEPISSISCKRKRSNTELKCKTVECSKRGKICRNENSFKQHLQTVHVPHTYKCSECLRMFKRKHDLQMHILTHENPVHWNFPCPTCKQKFKLKTDWEEHMLTVHNTEVATLFSCQVCDKNFITNTSLSVHKQRVHGVGVHVCLECKKAFKTKNSLLRHTNNFHKDAATWKLQCIYCGKKHYCKYNLRNHMIYHTNKMTIFSCKCCEQTFPGGRELAQHIITEHEANIYTSQKTSNSSQKRERKHQCSECGKCFKKPSYLKRHSFIHKSRSEWTLQCNILCGFMASRNDSLKEHMRVHEKTTISSICKFCNENFPDKQLLSLHVKSEHIDKGNVGGMEVLTCSKCDKKIVGKTALKKHMKTCHAVRTHKCLKCNKAFTTKPRLNGHAYIHQDPQTWKYKCSQCEKKFYRKHFLERHKFSHAKNS